MSHTDLCRNPFSLLRINTQKWNDWVNGYQQFENCQQRSPHCRPSLSRQQHTRALVPLGGTEDSCKSSYFNNVNILTRPRNCSSPTTEEPECSSPKYQLADVTVTLHNSPSPSHSGSRDKLLFLSQSLQVIAMATGQLLSTCPSVIPVLRSVRVYAPMGDVRGPKGHVYHTQTPFKLSLASADILLAKGWKMASAYSKNMARVWAQIRPGAKKLIYSTLCPAVITCQEVFLLDLKEQRRYFCLLIMAINRWLVSALVIFHHRHPNSWRFI